MARGDGNGCGVDTAAVGELAQRPRVVGHTVLFVASFSAVFVALGLSATTVGSTLSAHRPGMTRVSGLVIVAMALFLGGSFVLPALAGRTVIGTGDAWLEALAFATLGGAYGWRAATRTKPRAAVHAMTGLSRAAGPHEER